MIEEIFLFASGLALLTLVVVLAHAAYGVLRLRRMNPITAFFYAFIPQLFGAVYLLFDESAFDLEVRLIQATVVFGSYISILLGALVVSRVLNYDKAELSCYRLALDSKMLSFTIRCLVILTFLATAALLWLYYSRFVDTIPIVAMLIGNVGGEELREIRAAGYKTIPQYVTHPMNFFRLAVMPFLVTYTLVSALKHRVQKREVFLFLIVTASAVVYNSYTTALFPVAYIFLVIFVTLLIVGKLSLARGLTLVGLGLLFPVFSDLYLITIVGESTGRDMLLESVSRHFSRFFLDVPEIFAHYISVFQNDAVRTIGAAHRPIALLTGQEGVNVANMMFLHINPGGFRLGNASVPFYGYAYADFGFTGVIIFGLLIGMVLMGAHVYCIRSPRDSLYYARYIAVTITGAFFPATSFTTGFISKGLLPVLILPWLFRSLAIWYARLLRPISDASQGSK